MSKTLIQTFSPRFESTLDYQSLVNGQDSDETNLEDTMENLMKRYWEGVMTARTPIVPVESHMEIHCIW